MKTFEYSFTAGEKKTFPAGNFFMLLTTSSPVDVEFFKNGSPTEEKAEDVEAGFSVEPLIELLPGFTYFDKVEVTSAAAQTVKVAVSRGAGKYQRTVGTVDINSGKLTPQTLITSANIYASTTANTIVSAAANTAGVRVDMARLITSSGVGSAQILARTTAPTAYSNDGRSLASYWLEGTATAGLTLDLKNPVIIPAGEGIYAIASAVNLAHARIEYEVL